MRRARTKAPQWLLTRNAKKQKQNSIADAAGRWGSDSLSQSTGVVVSLPPLSEVVRADGAPIPSESGGSDTATTPMLCDSGNASSSGGGSSTTSDTTDPACTIQSFFIHLKGADLQQQIFMDLLCIAPFVRKKSGALSESTVLHIKDLFTHLPISLKQTLGLGHAAHYQSQLDAECTSSKYSERSPHWRGLFQEKPANTAPAAKQNEHRLWKIRCIRAKHFWRTTRFLPGLLAMRETQMTKLRNPCSQELAYHARCLLVQWKDALKGLHSVLVLAHINEDTVSQAVEEAEAISAFKHFQQRQPNVPLADSIETHEERAERWRTKQVSMWGAVFPSGYRMGGDAFGCYFSEQEQVRYNRWRFDAMVRVWSNSSKSTTSRTPEWKRAFETLFHKSQLNPRLGLWKMPPGSVADPVAAGGEEARERDVIPCVSTAFHV